MNKLILEIQVSLDGYLADEDGGTDWMIWNWGPEWNWDKELRQYHTQLTRSANNQILLSCQMAQEGFIAHWKQAALRNDEQSEFASHITDIPKLVISSRLTKADVIPGGWDNVEIASDPVEAILRLKQESDGQMLVYGGATLISSLLRHELIDEMHLLVNPVAIGSGLSIFKDVKIPVNVSLVKSTAFPCGVVALHYRWPN